ncbi:serine hydrolase domain-containing protein [Psychromicrobium sp. YIM B11713]|uniref:serine hydrolase domain-containing protein n=1 Tax=Psychromicrobium sp. YIM B11713 TaxID=3145233 RepID=UPI00374E6831
MQSLRADLEELLNRAVAERIAPSAVCAVAIDGKALTPIVVGDAVSFDDAGQPLPVHARIKAEPSTLYDLASITKIFSALTVLSLVDEGRLELGEPIGRFLPEYRTPAKDRVTLWHLLTHTSGLPATWEGWRHALGSGRGFNRADLVADLLHTELDQPPGIEFEYSCAGYNTMMVLAEVITGTHWAELVQERVLAHLATQELTGSPRLEHTAATEYQPEWGRGMVRGVVHDEAAWALSSHRESGLTGNAGMFGSVQGVLAFGESLRMGSPGILSPELAAEMWRTQLTPELITHSELDFQYGLGLGIAQRSWVGNHPEARGHNGFTGTSLLVDKTTKLSIVLLTNRVHPRRELSDVQALRQMVSNLVYDSLEHHAGQL